MAIGDHWENFKRGGWGKEPSEWIKKWFQSLFGLFIAIAFWQIFDSLFLGGLTLAFLFYIPERDIEEKGERKEDEGIKWVNRFLFWTLMVLLMASAFGGGLGLKLGGFWPWNWNTSAIIFVGIWVISFLAGSAGGVDSRQGVGIIMIVVSFFIFAFGVGTQEVGMAFFGQWWPTVYTTVTNVMEPITNVFTQLSQTFGTGIQLFVNPVGFAQNIMNGSYQQDPTSGITGAYGVEVEEYKATPIYPYQPWSVIMKIKNKGAFNAENVGINITSGYKAPKTGTITETELKIGELGFATSGKEPVQTCNGVCQKPIIASLPKLDIRQEFFQSTGVTCETINKYNLRGKFIPIEGTLGYDYKIHSSLDFEVMDREEWNRLVGEGVLITQTKKPASLTNAPVRLNIDTLEQPIREGTPFFIGLYLVSAQSGETRIENEIVQLEIPDIFAKSEDEIQCTSQPDITEKWLITWDNTDDRSENDWPDSSVVYCHFSPIEGVEEPTKTFLIRANANYTFIKEKTLSTKIEFGGGCCSDDDCSGDLKCTWKEGETEMGACE